MKNFLFPDRKWEQSASRNNKRKKKYRIKIDFFVVFLSCLWRQWLVRKRSECSSSFQALKMAETASLKTTTTPTTTSMMKSNESNIISLCATIHVQCALTFMRIIQGREANEKEQICRWCCTDKTIKIVCDSTLSKCNCRMLSLSVWAVSTR